MSFTFTVDEVPLARRPLPTVPLLLADTGLYFIPGAAWLGRALTDDDDLPPDQTDSFAAVRGRPPAAQFAAVPGAIHLAPDTLVDVELRTTDLGAVEVFADGSTIHTYRGPLRSLEISVVLPTGERLGFTLLDPPREPLAAWCAAIGHSE